ncbi:MULTISPECIES: hypothetical protein [unclassified Rathayibacter]|uniref:hypothetical protein n=1 Tax=unclassified Rathayibacter TaxID=2609250 RepID=UPI0011B0B89E|nr:MULTISPECIES: hypothetical protein [unclassified Rathayibacter]
MALFLATSLIASGPAQAETSATTSTLSPEVLHDTKIGDSLIFSDPAATPAQATPSSSGQTSLRAASFTITCTVDAQNPHISEGARKKGQIYVIYKTNVKCTGTGSYPPTASVRVRSGLMWDSASYNGDTSNGVNWQQVKSNDEPRTVKVNGSGNVFYTPAADKAGSTLTGHYQGSSTIEIITPTGQKTGSDISSPVFCKPTTQTAVCS